MSLMRVTKKYIFTVEGETEQWYLLWLRDRINECSGLKYDVSINVKVQQSPRKFYKAIVGSRMVEAFHICDIESNDPVHVEKFRNILSQMREASEVRNINYHLGYSNYTFELWMILHKRACNGSLGHRRQYLTYINQSFGEHYENLDQFKHEDNFKRCLSKLTLEDVKAAITRAEMITTQNYKDHRKEVHYRGYSYFMDNPSLSVHCIVKRMLSECGIIEMK